MANSPAQAAAWFRSGPVRTIEDGDWEGGCVAAVFTGGRFGHSYDFAVQAAVAAGAVYKGGATPPTAGTLNQNHLSAVDGEFHYYGGVWNAKDNRFDGHITLQYQGREYMASAYAQVQYGHHLGSSVTGQYTRVPYLGHSPYFGNQLLAGVTPAAVDQKPMTVTPVQIGKNMQLIQDTTNTYWLIAEDRGAFVVPDQPHADMVYRTITPGNKPARADLEYVIGLLNSAPWYSLAPAAATATVDIAAITAVVQNAVDAGLQGLVSDADLAKMQAAIIAAIPTGFAAVTPAKP